MPLGKAERMPTSDAHKLLRYHQPFGPENLAPVRVWSDSQPSKRSAVERFSGASSTATALPINNYFDDFDKQLE
jgi:hypothetical protein